jgi:hypothetical protein
MTLYCNSSVNLFLISITLFNIVHQIQTVFDSLMNISNGFNDKPFHSCMNCISQPCFLLYERCRNVQTTGIWIAKSAKHAVGGY